MLELVVVMVIASLLAGIALSHLGEVRDGSRAKTAMQEAQALVREARAEALLDDRVVLVAGDFGINDLDRSTQDLQSALSVEAIDEVKGRFWLYTSTQGIDVRIYSDGSLELASSTTPVSTAGTLTVTCIGSGITTCTSSTNEEAMYLIWETNNQGSASITVTPATQRGGYFTTTGDNDREAYLGMGSRGVTYTITLQVYETNDFTGSPRNSSTTYTVPVQ